MERSTTRRELLLGLAGTAGIAGCRDIVDPPGATPTETPGAAIPTKTPAEQDRTAEVLVFSDLGGQDWETKWTEEIIPEFESQSAVDARFHLDVGMVRVHRLLEEGRPPEIVHGTLFEHGGRILRGDTIPVGDLVAELEAANGSLYDTRSIRTGGATYIVPHGWSLGGVLNYREDIYKQLDLSVPETWEELIENARAIDEAETVDARGFGLPLVGRDQRLDNDFTNWLYTAGGGYWRWTDEERSELEVDFREDHVQAALEMVQNLAEFSPDPSDYAIGSLFRDWALGDVAQCINPNAWLAGFAYFDGAEEIALNTKQAILPLRDRSLDPPTRGWSATVGSPIFTRSDNHPGARELLRFVHKGPERQAKMNVFHPMRWLPPYEGIMETDSYRGASIFDIDGGHFLELNQHCVNEIAPYHRGSRPQNPAALWARHFKLGDELTEAVIPNGAPVDEEIERVRSRLSHRLEEGRSIYK